MKTRPIEVESETVVMDTTLLKEEIKKHFDDFYTAQELAEDMEQGFIFGKYAKNQHFSIDTIMELINEVQAELNPVEVTDENINTLEFRSSPDDLRPPL